jgi:zinc ribbon protein
MKQCPSCSSEILDNSTFCSHCGGEVEKIDDGENTNVSEVQSPTSVTPIAPPVLMKHQVKDCPRPGCGCVMQMHQENPDKNLAIALIIIGLIGAVGCVGIPILIWGIVLIGKNKYYYKCSMCGYSFEMLPTRSGVGGGHSSQVQYTSGSDLDLDLRAKKILAWVGAGILFFIILLIFADLFIP